MYNETSTSEHLQNMCESVHESMCMCPRVYFCFLYSNLCLWNLSVDSRHCVQPHIFSYDRIQPWISPSQFTSPWTSNGHLSNVGLYVMMSCCVHCSIHQCVMLCAEKHVHVYTHVYEGQRATPAAVLHVLSTLYLRQSISLIWSSQSRLCWLAIELHRSVCLCLPNSESQHACCCAYPFKYKF